MKIRALLGVAVVTLGVTGALWLQHGRSQSVLQVRRTEFTVSWRGVHSGQATFKARLNWCPVTRVGVLEGISGDSGSSVVFFEREGLVSGLRPVVAPDAASSAARPVAVAALRWLREEKDTALAGYRSRGGRATLQVQGGLASGEVRASMISVSGTDTLSLRGVFRDVPVTATAVGCA